MANFTDIFDLNKTFHFAVAQKAFKVNQLDVTYVTMFGFRIKEYWRSNPKLSLEEIIENICTDYDDATQDDDTRIPYPTELYHYLRNLQKTYK